MALIEVCIQVRIEPSCGAPEVRLWLDLLPAHGLSTEIELPLSPRGCNRWTGAFAVGERASFSYRVGVAAHAGASWSLSFRDRGSGRELLTDCDLLGGSKAWLTGTCVVEVPGSRAIARSRTPWRS